MTQEPKEKPILFTDEMVRAILDGRKTQTRRIVKPQPPQPIKEGVGIEWQWWDEREAFVPNGTLAGFTKEMRSGIRCPYGQPGDRLWVKETHFRWGRWVRNGKTKTGKPAWKFKPEKRLDRPMNGVAFDDLNEHHDRIKLDWHKRPSIFMPRSASRIILEMIAVRVERVQDVSDEDVKAEGVDRPAPFTSEPQSIWQAAYQDLWNSINGKKHPWKSNPWVWIISFSRVSSST
jgi:hypothetical protein